MKKKILIGTLLFFLLLTFCLSGGVVAYANTNNQIVYLGGTPIGISSKCDGVIIVDFLDVLTEKGRVRPSEESGLEKGDLIIKIDNTEIKGPEDISKALDSYPDNQAMTITVKRQGVLLEYSVTPAIDMVANQKKLGLHVKNELAGVGTLTYVKAVNKRFGGLGHQIYDEVTTDKSIYQSGKVYPCSIIGVIKGEAGKAGELRGSFRRHESSVGVLDKNTFSGVFGKAEPALYDNRPMISVGSRDMVKAGKAHIYTTIKGEAPARYEIEIVKVVKQNNPADRSMVIRITDEKLLSATGGIVQGMSGSPIIQNNRIIGAVTHVFINDPTRGYGIYIDWMIDN